MIAHHGEPIREGGNPAPGDVWTCVEIIGKQANEPSRFQYLVLADPVRSDSGLVEFRVIWDARRHALTGHQPEATAFWSRLSSMLPSIEDCPLTDTVRLTDRDAVILRLFCE